MERNDRDGPVGLCFVYLVKEVASLRSLGQLLGEGCSTL